MAKYVKRTYRCACGRIRPAARKYCYTCRPKYGRYQELPENQEPWTISELVAISRACDDLSYWQLVAMMEAGVAPPIVRKVQWPEGSVFK